MPKGTYELIADYTATSSSSSSYTFSDLKAGVYTDIQAICYFRTTSSGGAVGYKCYFNGSGSTTNYTTKYHEVNNSNTFNWGTIGNDSSSFVGYTSSADPNVPVISIVDFPEYNSTTGERFFFARHGSYPDFNGWYANRWNQTSAVTSITFLSNSGNFNTGTRISLFGIKGEK